jgi:hypothetical protein
MKVKGVSRLHKNEEKGSITIFLKKEIAEQIELPAKKDLLAEYDTETKELTIKEL